MCVCVALIEICSNCSWTHVCNDRSVPVSRCVCTYGKIYTIRRNPFDADMSNRQNHFVAILMIMLAFDNFFVSNRKKGGAGGLRIR